MSAYPQNGAERLRVKAHSNHTATVSLAPVRIASPKPSFFTAYLTLSQRKHNGVLRPEGNADKMRSHRHADRIA